MERKDALGIGLLFLALLGLGPFTILYVPGQLVVAQDAAATWERLVAREGLLRWGVLASLGILLAEIAISVLLYRVLRPVGQTLALAAMGARAANGLLHGVTLVGPLGVLVLLEGAAPGLAAEPLALWLMELDAQLVLVWQSCFALHLLLLGVLVRRAGWVPGVFGPLLLLAGAGYLLEVVGLLLAPGQAALWANIVMVCAIVGELPFFLWVLWRGLRGPGR